MLTKRLLPPVILVIVLAGLVLFGLGDTNTLVGDNNISDNEVASHGFYSAFPQQDLTAGVADTRFDGTIEGSFEGKTGGE